MKNILLISAKKAFAYAEGRLSMTLHETARDTLAKVGYTIRDTIVDDGYDIQDEIQKILWAHAIIYQIPAWWMGPPWILKKYFDEVFTEAHGIFFSDQSDFLGSPSKKYGSGGLLHGKRYMISTTWDAPQEAFDTPNQFMCGIGIDMVFLAVHKAHAFLGMSAMPTFLCTNVSSTEQVQTDIERYRRHLLTLFGKSCDR